MGVEDFDWYGKKIDDFERLIVMQDGNAADG